MLMPRSRQHPNFMAFFPASSTYPGMLGELYSSAFTAAAFNWLCSPAVTELETIVLDWLAKILSLPPSFLSSGEGGGVIQGSASEAIVTVMVAARDKYLRESTAHLEGAEKERVIAGKRGRLVALGSEMAHSSTQKAALITGTRFRAIQAELGDNLGLTGENFRKAVDQCKLEGLEPFYLTASLGQRLLAPLVAGGEGLTRFLGTTATCAVDNFGEITEVLRENPAIWVHVDAAYAGAALVCEEYQHLTHHMDAFDSFDMNMHKWLLTNFDARYSVPTLPLL
jgi:aromatic-L-amino-acid decarboxylase